MNASSKGKADFRQKYDAVASVYSTRYTDPNAIARRQVALVAQWGTPLLPGSAVLEVGCADGFVTEALASAGFAVTAVDLSPAMVVRTRRRVESAGLCADVRVADLDDLDLGPFDAILALMQTFFSYASNPALALSRLGARATRKLLVDVNPRETPVKTALAGFDDAGLTRLAWRPFLVPQSYRLPAPALAALQVAERIPLARSLPLPWKFNVVIKAERP